MALINSRPVAAANGLGDLLSNLTAWYAVWNNARITRKELSALSNRELDDLGISRSDIETIATGTSAR